MMEQEYVPSADTAPGGPRNAWLTTEGAEPFKAAHATHEWEPYLNVGDGYKSLGYRRADGAGYVLPCIDESGEIFRQTGDWWAVWAHPMLCGRPGWFHHALGGRFRDVMAAAYAFDHVYELERIAGNTDRMTRTDAQVIEARRAETAQTGSVADESAVTK